LEANPASLQKIFDVVPAPLQRDENN